jgi:hypothetical protein
MPERNIDSLATKRTGKLSDESLSGRRPRRSNFAIKDHAVFADHFDWWFTAA